MQPCSGSEFRLKSMPISNEIRPGVHVAALLVFSLALPGAAGYTLHELCSAFRQFGNTSCSDADWVGTLKDLFSPDDSCAKSTRYIDASGGSRSRLEISASDTGSDCKQVWGRRFNSSSSINPVLTPTAAGLCSRRVSFRAKFAPSEPFYYAVNGSHRALDFTLKLGSAFGDKMISWNGLFDGHGGYAGTSSARQHYKASACNNFWLYTHGAGHESEVKIVEEEIDDDPPVTALTIVFVVVLIAVLGLAVSTARAHKRAQREDDGSDVVLYSNLTIYSKCAEDRLMEQEMAALSQPP